jgi:hypothetical protein
VRSEIDHEHYCVLGCDAVKFGTCLHIFRRGVLSGLDGATSQKTRQFFQFTIILPAVVRHEIHLASNANNYQKQKHNVSGE